MESEGVDYVHDEIIVTYKVGTSGEDQKILEDKFSLKVIRKFRLTNSIFYKIQSTEEPVVLKKKIIKYEFVKVVTLNKALTTNSLNLDSEFSKQWYMENTGQQILFEPGIADIDIGWKKAMEIYTKKANSYVAVLDSGFAEDHIEIKDRNAINTDEYLGQLGKDDDNNGYVDDTYGWDFYDNDPNPYDFHGHGTQISSIISAANDGAGMQGISPDTFIFPMRVAGQWEDGVTRPTLASVVEALNYIYYNPGIRVVNLSISLPEDELLALTIEQFDQNDRVLLICAAGNDKINIDLKSIIPASLNSDCIISVASVNSSGDLSFFSNYGKSNVDLAAPGEKIFVATIKEVIQKHHPIDPYFWTQTFNWSESPLTWYKGESYQESFFYKSPTFFTPYSSVTYFTQLTNFLDPIKIGNSIMPTLKLKLMYNIEPPSYAFLFASSDSLGPFTLKKKFYGSTNANFEYYPISISEFKSLDDLYLKFVVFKSNPFDYFGLGTISHWDLDVENYTGKPYYSYVDGTSFSAPIVAAVASMLFSHRPDLLASDVKKIILDSVKPLDSLSNKVLSGGVVRVDNALIEANKYRERVKVEFSASSWFKDLIVSSSGVITENNEYGTSDVGTTFGAGWYFKGDTVTIDAFANDGWKFGQWADIAFGGPSKHTFTINDNLNLTGLFHPNLSDEDNDSLEYYYEIDFGTDPSQFDSDGDSIGDGDEVRAYFIAKGLNPTVDNSEILINLEEIFGRDAFHAGEQSVLGNPSAYNLFTSVQYEEALQSLDTNATPYTPDWFYTPARGWMWSQKGVYPYFFDANSSKWMYFQSGQENPRFYHYGTKEWMTLE